MGFSKKKTSLSNSKDTLTFTNTKITFLWEMTCNMVRYKEHSVNDPNIFVDV